VDAIHSGELGEAATAKSPVFHLQVPTECTGVPSNLLLPHTQWDDHAAFDDALAKLGKLFHDNFEVYTRPDAQVDRNLLSRIERAGPVLR